MLQPVRDLAFEKSSEVGGENSISAEKRKWMQSGVEVPFKDMMSKWQTLQLDHNKVQPMFLMCRDLRDALQNLKSAIEQEEAEKGGMPPA